MKKIRIPRRPKRLPFKAKFARDARPFGSGERYTSPDLGSIPLLLLCMLGAVILTAAVMLLGKLPKVTAVSAEDGTYYTAAAVLAHELAKEAAFFSVGTNDLTQYTLAVDRQNAKLGEFYDPYHPALLALMAHIAKAANDNGIWAGICGELGADPKMQEKFIEMGYTELSMAAGRILETRKLVCESNV